MRSSLDFTKSRRVVTLEFLGGVYVSSGIGAYVRGIRIDLSPDTERVSASKARKTANFMLKDEILGEHA